MRRVALFLLMTALVVLMPAAATAAPLADHLVLISIDGLRPEFYLDETWPTPMLQQMRREGAHAKRVRVVFPSVTYPCHTTMVTGALPARHGVYYNRPFDPAGESQRWYWEASLIRVPTLWDAVARSGQSSASVTWPVTVGASIDWNVPEVWSLDPEEDPLGPMRELSMPPGLVAEIEAEATGPLTEASFGHKHITRDDQAGAMAAYLFQRYRPTLLAVHLIETDIFQHEHGREGWMARRAVAAADRAVSRIVEEVERSGLLARTSFLVVGDHGFVDVHTRIVPNVWLVDAGLRGPGVDRGDWRATFHVNGSAATLHLRGVADKKTLARVLALLNRLPAGTRKLFRVLSESELREIGAAPDAALALAPMPGVKFTSGSEGPAVLPGKGATHGYHPEVPEIHTGLVAWGAGVRAGAVAPLLGLEDIAPLASEILDLGLEAPDGAVPLGLLDMESND